jgi:hypothetical protein
MKPDRRPLRLSDEWSRSDVLPTNAMIPPPHGFARTEDSIGNEKNITFLGRRYAGRPHVRFGSKADMCGAKEHVRFSPESGHVQRN